MGSISRLLKDKILLPYLEDLGTAKVQILQFVSFAKQSLDIVSFDCPWLAKLRNGALCCQSLAYMFSKVVVLDGCTKALQRGLVYLVYSLAARSSLLRVSSNGGVTWSMFTVRIEKVCAPLSF
jgi:hypothetical protein